jgi:hypothetical protein
MSGCTLRLARNSPLRTTLVDEDIGKVKYKIETPMRIARSVTRIRKFESLTQPPLRRDESADSDSANAITVEGKRKEGSDSKEEGNETELELHETGEEIARIYWKWFSLDRFIFRGRIATRDEFLPKCRKMKG